MEQEDLQHDRREKQQRQGHEATRKQQSSANDLEDLENGKEIAGRKECTHESHRFLPHGGRLDELKETVEAENEKMSLRMIRAMSATFPIVTPPWDVGTCRSDPYRWVKGGNPNYSDGPPISGNWPCAQLQG